MVRTVFRIAVALLIVHALYQFLPVYVRYHLFKDDLKQAALFGGGVDEAGLLEQVMEHAQARRIPLDPAGVSVRRVNNQTFIDAAWEQPVRVLPWYTYQWNAEAAAHAMHLHGPAGAR